MTFMMKITHSAVISASLLLLASCQQKQDSDETAYTEDLSQYVRPLVGTSGFGNTYPGSQVPFGGIQISPDTDTDDYDTASGYKYDHPTLLGFSLTHFNGTGIPDLGDFLFMPGTGKLNLKDRKSVV